MVRRQLASRGIRSRRVLEVMGRIPRECFMPASERARAYDDTPLPIGFGATISQPYIVALMTEALDPQPGERILEVGTGSGYQTAILAELSDQVHTLEIVPELSAQARATLHELGYDWLHFQVCDGRKGWPDAAPFDGIVVTAAPEEIPPALLEQLGPAGRLVSPVGCTHQELVLLRRTAAGLERRALTAVRFVPLLGDAT
jgi:protein-L-isoaspartate(D-aspartate) O-methyltransferase